MEILGIGPFELIIILILALAVFGPDKLPEIGAKLGRSMRQMRKATREFSRELEKARQALDPDQEISRPLEEIKEVAKDATALAMAARDPGRAIRDSVMRELTTPPGAEPGSGASREVQEVGASPDALNESGRMSPPGAEPGSGASPGVEEVGASPDALDESGQMSPPGAEPGSGASPDGRDESGVTPHPGEDPLPGRED